MNTLTLTDGSKLFYKDWGSGIPVVFSHGWPLTADAWESQMVFLAAHGFAGHNDEIGVADPYAGHESVRPMMRMAIRFLGSESVFHEVDQFVTFGDADEGSDRVDNSRFGNHERRSPLKFRLQFAAEPCLESIVRQIPQLAGDLHQA